MRYLTTDELLYINGRVLNNQRILLGEQQIRDIGLLQAAVQRPQSSAFGMDAFPSRQEKAAALLHAIVRNHPFTDGNKRTGTVGMIFFLQVNGLCPIWSSEEALHVILETALGRVQVGELATWLSTKPCQAYPKPNIAQDMGIISEIMERHNWLLEQLASR
ncbi:MAG: Fic family protein [Chloroflexi bacterium]|nr:MAG: Fic family protein [Chloroflexota bacterium]